LRCKDGSVVLVLASAAALTDEAGQMVGLLAIARDITKQRADETAAWHLASLVESSSDAIISVNASGIVQSWNSAAEQLLGYTAAEIIGTHSARLVPPERRQELADLIAKMRRGERVTDHETVRLHKDGSSVHVAVTLSWIMDATGKFTGFSSIGRDIGPRRKLERQVMQAERMASVGVLASGIAHEINNPLAYVLGNLDVLREQVQAIGTLAPTLQGAPELLAEIRDGAERIARIVGGLKAFSRLDDEQLRPLDLRPVLERVVILTQNEIKHRALLVTAFDETPRVLGDEGRLVQVFVNLVVNAIQAMRKRGLDQNEIRIATCTDARGRAVVDVHDNGLGIPDEIAQRIFDPFFTTKPVGEGTGLGLAVCEGIVRSHGGEISVESHPESGTTFRVALPPAPATEPSAKAPPRRTPRSVALSRRGKVLIVDDEPMIGKTLLRILSAEHDVSLCLDGQQAIDLMRGGERFDVILCDLMMPGVTGIAVYAEVCDLDAEQAARMIFVTGGAFTPEGSSFLAEVTNLQIRKPFDADAVRQLVRTVVAQPT